ncbi:hypothetical protein G6F33_013726 [Rhizopus arrhizus]|nr:hypothetical protein G6F33_013726 [Rhizopus arrhizus]
MVLSNKNSLVTLGAPSKPNKPPNIDNNSTTPDELHTSPSLNYLTAITGKLSSSDPRVVTKSSTVTLNANCRPSASATSAPTYISILNDPLRPATPVTYTVGQKIAARNPFFSIFVAYILPQWYKLPLFLHSRFPTCLEKSERV